MDIGLLASAFAGMLAGFFGVTKMILNQSSLDRERDRAERTLLTKSIKNMAKATEKVAVATERSASEAKQRNGHLGEQNMQIAALVSRGNTNTDKMLDALLDQSDALVRNKKHKAIGINTMGLDLESTS